MHARVSTYGGASDELVAGFDRATGPVQEIPGFAGAYFLVDRDGNKAMSVTLWESEEALEASVERANQLRQDAAGSIPIENVDHYEVAIQI
jgi:heme-degrading monooxygenase HmoA